MNLESHDAVTCLRMESGKGNAINVPMLERLDACLDEFEKSGAKALVLIGTGKTFCAGLDLVTVLDLDRDGVGALMDLMHRVFLRLFALPRPVVAAVNGHAIAGGCVLVQQADFRIMRKGEFKIGLNETRVGVGLPAAVVETMRYHVPASSFLPVALLGSLFPPQAALERGLLDELADDVEARALGRAKVLAEIPAPAYAQVKTALRAPAVERSERMHATEAARWLDTCFSDEARARIAEIVKRLRS